MQEESETEEQEDVISSIEEAISRTTITEWGKNSLHELIASITAEQPTTTTPPPTTTKNNEVSCHNS